MKISNVKMKKKADILILANALNYFRKDFSVETREDDVKEIYKKLTEHKK